MGARGARPGVLCTPPRPIRNQSPFCAGKPGFCPGNRWSFLTTRAACHNKITTVLAMSQFSGASDAVAEDPVLVS